MKNIVIYHKDCQDGLCAAAVMLQFFERQKPQEEVVFIAMQYGDEVPNDLIPTASDVWLVDFSLPPDVLESLCARANKVVVLDHHRSAIEKLAKFSRYNCTLLLMESMSGAMLAWQFCNGPAATPPALVLHAQDYDLWTWDTPKGLPGTLALNAYLTTIMPTPHAWSYTMGLLNSREFLDNAIESGNAILAYQDAIIKRAVENTKKVAIGDHQMYAVNSTVLQGQIGAALCKKYPDEEAVCIFNVDLAKAIIKFSFRSTKGLAKKYADELGGGGHPNAASAARRLCLPISE